MKEPEHISTIIERVMRGDPRAVIQQARKQNQRILRKLRAQQQQLELLPKGALR